MVKTGNESNSRLSPPRTTPPSAQGLHAPLSADGGGRDVLIFECGTATNVRFDGLRGSLHTGVQVELSTGRRSPKTATSRGRPPQRRNDHDPRTPRKGRLRPCKLQLNPTRCIFHLLPILVYRKGHLCGIPMPLSHSRRSPSTATPRGRPPRRRNVTTPANCGRVASGQGSLYCTWSRGPGRAREARCSALAESSRGTT